MHKIQASGMKPDLPLAAFVKSLYPTHFNYLESLQASDKFKSLTFDTLVEKIADREKAFGKKTTEHLENHFALLKKKRTTPKTNPMIIPKEKAAREVETTPTKDQI